MFTLYAIYNTQTIRKLSKLNAEVSVCIHECLVILTWESWSELLSHCVTSAG